MCSAVLRRAFVNSTTSSPGPGALGGNATVLRPAAAGAAGGDLGVDLVGGDLEQHVVDGDRVTGLLQPPGDGALGDSLTELRHRDPLHASTLGVCGATRRHAFFLAAAAAPFDGVRRTP